MTSLDRIAARLAGDIARLDWRMSRMRRPGVVVEYDAEKHKARARLNTPNGKGGLTPWCDIEEASGAHNSRTTLTVGQSVWVNCPNGDLRQAKISAGIFSDEYKSTSTAAEETRFERGDVSVAIRPDMVEISKGGSHVKIAGDKVSIHTTGTAEFT